MSLEILPHQLTPDLDELYLDYVTEVLEDPELPSLAELIKMFKYCPYNGIAVELKSLRAAAAIGNYTQPDTNTIRASTGQQTIEEWVLSNFETMRGDLAGVAQKMMLQAFAFGYSVGEIVFSPELTGYMGEWRLFKIKVLNPCRYTFAGRLGEWDRIIYRSHYKKNYPIPRQKLIHIYIPSIVEPENPYGLGQGVRGYAYYRARTLALKNWNEHLVRNNKGTTIIQGDSNVSVPVVSNGVQLYGANNKPLIQSALKNHAELIARSKEGDVIALPKNVSYAHHPTTNNLGTDYDMALRRYSDDIWTAYGIPKTMLQEGNAALGQAGLSANHRLMLDTQLEKIVTMFRSQMIEMVIRPLLRFNFGIRNQDNLGSFKTNKLLPPEQASMRANLIASGMLQGIIPSDDIRAINRYYADCGLDPIRQEDFDRRQIEKLVQQQIEQEQAAYAQRQETVPA